MSEIRHRQTVCVKKRRRRELPSNVYSVNTSIQGLEDYITKSKERLITAAIDNIITDRKTKKKSGNWNGKKNNSVFLKRKTGKIARMRMWIRLK